MKKTPKPIEPSIENCLRNLPREKASRDFAARTLRASQKPERRWFFHPMLVTAFLTVVGMVVSWSGLQYLRPDAPYPALTVAEELPADQDDLEELKMLQKMSQELDALVTAPQKQPYLRVQGAAQKAYFIDMRSFAEATSKTAYAHFRPTRTL